MIHGIEITLYVKAQTGVDGFGSPVYEETQERVKNVLVGEPTAEELINEMQLHGQLLAYTLGIPKGDTHDWNDVTVEFFGQQFQTYGPATEGIEAMIPLNWNKKVKVRRIG